MSEIVKVDGKWNLTKEKAIELGFKSLPQLVKHFKKEYIVPYLSAQIDKNKLTGKDRSLARKGFGEIWVDGKRKYISNVTSYFDNRSSNVGFTDKTKSQARQEVRDENIYELSPAGKAQIEMLKQTKVYQAEYEASNDPNAAKIFHKKMEKLFKKHYRGRIKYDPNKTYGIDKEISEDSLRQWQNDIYQGKTGTPGKDVDHGKMAKYGGTHSLTNLSQQDEFWNRIVKNAKAEFMRTDDVYEDDMIAHSPDLALQEHIGLGENVKLLSDYDEEALTEYHKYITKPGDQIRAEAEIRQQEQTYQSQIEASRILPANLFSIGPKTFERAHSLTQTAGRILGGPFEKVTQIDETLNKLVQDDKVGATVSAFKTLTQTEYIPFSENRNLPSSNY
tara:strand:+ start:360 stop:1529 length:1170 start_codon:yes stop_codon:yes gene_type:complete